MGVGLPEIEEVFVSMGREERLCPWTELRDSLITDFRTDLIAFRPGAEADAGHQVLWQASKILGHTLDQVGCHTGHSGSP